MVENDFKSKILSFVVFVSIVILLITTVFNIHLLFIEEPEYRTMYMPYYEERNIDCKYNNVEINECYAENGQIIYKEDCSIECDYTYAEEQALRDSINEKKSWIRVILSLVLLLSFGFITIKDKLLHYALITGSLISLVAATIISFNTISRQLYPIVTIVELIVIYFLYKTLFKKKM